MATKKIISLLLVLVMLGSLVTPVVAEAEGYDSENCSDITLKRIVEVEIEKNRKAI